MTNREWLSTLTDEEFVEWALSDYVSAWMMDQDNNLERLYPPQSYSPTLAEIINCTTNAKLKLKAWLEEERKDER